jgi:hypothetical protein
MSSATEIATVIEKSKPLERGPCHTIDHRGWALCGAFGPNSGAGRGHSHWDCVAGKHKRCVTCKELERQLGDDDHRMVS